MIRYVIKRLLLTIPVVFCVAVLIFTILFFTPGDPATAILGPGATSEERAQVHETLGLDEPYFVQLGKFLLQLVRLDLGESWVYRTNISQEIAARLPRTAAISIYSVLISAILGIPLGILAAVHQDGIADKVVLVGSSVMRCIPNFWIGMMLLLWIAMNFTWFPINGVSTWKGYILPCAALTFCNAAPLMRLTRSAMLETIRSDYIRTARAKGALEKRVIWKHALKNALLPVVTNIGNNFRALLGGSVITETVFVIPGLGSYVISAIRSKDVPVVMGCTLFMSATFLIVILLTDILYAYIDPRVKAKYMK